MPHTRFDEPRPPCGPTGIWQVCDRETGGVQHVDFQPAWPVVQVTRVLSSIDMQRLVATNRPHWNVASHCHMLILYACHP
jgi:hypothetical protein